ncbi:MAG: acyclic terpene utilization AtuA family protein [Gammaproteobacteria bacterium]
MKTVRIGGAGGFLGDSSTAAPQLLRGGNLDYIVLDYLAEATMSLLARGQARQPEGGFARDFTDWIWRDNLRELKIRGVKLVTNAGALNPRACRARMEAIAAEAGLSFRIAVIEGDDLRPRLPAIAGRGLTEMFTGAPFPEPARVLSANAYLGAGPIAAALDAGAEIVITGRVVDSALVLGPLMHEFGWSASDYDLLAAGSLAGHVLECGAQATGGLFTDWEQVPDWAHIGYPIAECTADGSFVVTKPDGTGGLCVPATVAEQILYEIGDPQAYLLPDVACDFSGVRVESAGPGRVRVSGARGRPPTGRYKICVTWRDGHRCIAVMPVLGRDAARKAARQADAVLERVAEMLAQRNLAPLRAARVETLGAEASYGAHAGAAARATREVVCKIAVEHEDPKALEVFLREFDSPATSMAVGSAGWFGGRPAIAPVVRVYSCALDWAEIEATISLDGVDRSWSAPSTPARFDPATMERPAPPPAPAPAARMVERRLIDLAWARSGDKGDAFNVGVIARDPRYLPWIRAALTADAVRSFLAHEFEGGARPAVARFELPGLHALNFLCTDALGGGQLASLRIDPLAKGKAQQLLEYPIPLPADLAPESTS